MSKMSFVEAITSGPVLMEGVLGGCCGTDGSHMEAIARKIAK